MFVQTAILKEIGIMIIFDIVLLIFQCVVLLIQRIRNLSERYALVYTMSSTSLIQYDRQFNRYAIGTNDRWEVCTTVVHTRYLFITNQIKYSNTVPFTDKDLQWHPSAHDSHCAAIKRSPQFDKVHPICTSCTAPTTQQQQRQHEIDLIKHLN